MREIFHAKYWLKYFFSFENVGKYRNSITENCRLPFLGDKHTQICGAKSIKCYNDAEERLYGEDVIDFLSDPYAQLFRKQCNCLSNCQRINYEIEIKRAKLASIAQWLNFSDIVIPDNQEGSKLVMQTINPIYASAIWISNFHSFRTKPSRLLISFGSHKVPTLKRKALYSEIEFMAVCGGLLGLFLGLSTFSVLQFIYRFTFRSFCALRQLKSKHAVTPFQSSYAITNNTIHTINAVNAKNNYSW